MLGNNLPQLQETTARIAKAQSEDPLGVRLGFLKNDRVLGPALGAEISAGKRRVSENENLSPTQNLIQTIKNEQATALIDQGSPVLTILNDIGTSLQDLLGRDRNILRDNVSNPNLSPEVRLDIAERLRETTASQGIGPLGTQAQLESANRKYDRMIELLQQQVNRQPVTQRAE